MRADTPYDVIVGELAKCRADCRALREQVEARDEVLNAIRLRRCNGCRRPWTEWGPVCGGVTQGDYTHFHSTEFWLARLDQQETDCHAKRPNGLR